MNSFQDFALLQLGLRTRWPPSVSMPLSAQQHNGLRTGAEFIPEVSAHKKGWQRVRTGKREVRVGQSATP